MGISYCEDDMIEWHEHKEFQWLLTDKDNYVIGQIKHWPTGWTLQWRYSTKHPRQVKLWPDGLEALEEAKAWGLAMIRMQ